MAKVGPIQTAYKSFMRRRAVKCQMCGTRDASTLRVNNSYSTRPQIVAACGECASHWDEEFRTHYD